MRYGQHHARSADALAWLLVHDPVTPQEEHAVLLSCRAALIRAHRERCERAVRGGNVQLSLFNNRRLGRDLALLARGSATALKVLLDEYPTFADQAVRFTDVLQRKDLSPQAQAWVEAARHAILATESAVTSTAWTEHPEQAWQVVADIADSAQALVRLDARIGAVDPTPSPSWSRALRFPAAELTLVSRHVGYVARSGDLDAAVDSTHRSEMHRGLLRVHDLGSAVEGARVLSRHLQTTQISVPDLRRFAVMHSELCHLSVGALQGLNLEEIQSDYRRREVRFREVAGMTARVRSGPLHGGTLALRQTQEIGRAVLASVRRHDKRLPGILADLNGVYPEISSAVARGVSRSLAEGRYLVVDDSAVDLTWRRTRAVDSPQLGVATRQLLEADTAERSAETVDFVTRRIAVLDSPRASPAGDSLADPARQRLQRELASDPGFRRPPAPNRRLSAHRL